MPKDPITHFSQWFKTAQNDKAIIDATVMCLSTLDSRGFPDGRMVLLKEFDENGFIFYTNLNSTKGLALKKMPRAALTFHWAPLERQVRIQGKTEIVSDTEANAYWQTRPRLSQLGAWASRQSEPLSTRAILVKDVAKLALKCGTGPVPRPPYWTGIRVVPTKIEFWQGRANRLHDRFLYSKNDGRWKVTRLYP